MHPKAAQVSPCLLQKFSIGDDPLLLHSAAQKATVPRAWFSLSVFALQYSMGTVLFVILAGVHLESPFWWRPSQPMSLPATMLLDQLFWY